MRTLNLDESAFLLVLWHVFCEGCGLALRKSTALCCLVFALLLVVFKRIIGQHLLAAVGAEEAVDHHFVEYYFASLGH